MDGYLSYSLIVKVCQYVSLVFKRRSLRRFHVDLQLFPGLFLPASHFSWVNDSAVVMTGTGDTFLHVAVKLGTHTKACVWNEPWDLPLFHVKITYCSQKEQTLFFCSWGKTAKYYLKPAWVTAAVAERENTVFMGCAMKSGFGRAGGGEVCMLKQLKNSKSFHIDERNSL